MICPKCKNQIPDKALKCSVCNTKIASLCKKCNAYNPIYNLRCTSCDNELLKACPSCKSVNLPQAKICRKCNYKFPTIQEDSKIENNTEQEPESLEEQEKKDTFSFDYSVELHSQQMAKKSLLEAITSENKKIISLNGAKGIGKSIVLKATINDLKDHEIIWLFGECNAITQISPCGLLQDILLTFFNIANFCTDGLKLKKESQKFFQSEFPSLTNEEIFNLLNILYPTNTDYFENILINKEKTFILLKKVFKTITENNKTVFVIENFDLIDGFSYEFIHHFLNSETFNNEIKFLITYNERRPAQGYLYSTKLKDINYLDISLSVFDRSQMNSFIDQYFSNEECPDSVKSQLFNLSSGNPAVLEQYVSLLLDYKKINNSFGIKFPTMFENIIQMRLNFLKENHLAYKVLSLAAIQGIKFSHIIINQILKIGGGQLIETLDLLQRLNFIAPVSENYYTFKNSMLWSYIFEIIKQSEDFITLNNNLFAALSVYTLSSHSIMAVIAQNTHQDLSALNFWTDNTKIASYIGDTNLYAISQKQCLILIDKLDKNNPIVKDNIYERLGKLLSKTNSKEALDYLPNSILNAKKQGEILKEIELTGYLANCCINLGNYFGTIECIDSVLEKIDTDYDLEIAMLKSRKIDALLNIGNSGEIINLVDNEILPVFDKYIDSKPHKNIPIQVLYKSWLQTYLILANALIFQGNNRSFDVLSTLFELFRKNNFDDKLFICKTKLALAFANTIKGDIEASEEILTEIIKVYKTDIMDNEAISRWNLINIINNFTQKKYSGLKEELFQVVTFANNINDNFTKNILKTMLGKLLKDEDNTKQALDIYSEQITYFSKEKNAIGALLCWYLIAKAKLITEGPEKSLEVAKKALDVAQSPKINNYFFIVLYNKVIAEAFMVLSDYESARVHIEKAIMIARKFELLQLTADLYLLYGKHLQDMALVKTDSQTDYILNTSKMYKKASMIARSIKNNHIISKVEKSKAVLNSFCQLNGIILKDE